MKYSQMLFLPKNVIILIHMLPSTAHSFKNKENVKFPGHCWKYGRVYFTLWYFFFHRCVSEDPDTFVVILSNGGAGFLFRHSKIFLTSWGLVTTEITIISWPHFSKITCDFGIRQNEQGVYSANSKDRLHRLFVSTAPSSALRLWLILFPDIHQENQQAVRFQRFRVCK